MKKILLGIGIIGVITFLALMFFKGDVKNLKGVSSDVPTVTQNTFRYYDFFASTTAQTNFATTTSATSTNITSWTTSSGMVDKGYFVVAGAKKVTMFFTRGDTLGTGNTGTTTYKVQTSPDGTTWYDFKKLVQATSTSISNAVIQATAGIEAATLTLSYGLDLNFDAVYAIRCIVVETIDGDHSCASSAQF